MDKREGLLRKARAAVALLLVALYVAGLIAMLASNVQLGLILWVVSTLGGGGMLYWMKKARENAEGEQKDGEA